MRKNNNPDPSTLPGYVEHADRPYRPGVGIVLFNRDGRIFVGERLDNPGKWQMPQGGIDDGEEAEIAVFRELEEEIGTRNARILSVMKEWLFYDIPVHTANKLWNAKYRGQKQKWIALEYLGNDEDINLSKHDTPEFMAWKWIRLDELLDYVVPFKRETYEIVMDHFSDIAQDFADAAAEESHGNSDK